MTAFVYGMPIAIVLALSAALIFGASELGWWFGHRAEGRGEAGVAGTLAGASLGVLALLIGFSFSIALSRYDARREAVLEEANAIGSTANFALMLPRKAQPEIFRLLREYAAVRTHLGIPYDPAKFDRDVATSIVLQNRLWQQAAAVSESAPQSLPVYQFVANLNELNNAHERRVTTLRVRIPVEVIVMLIGTALVGMGFVGFHIGMGGKRQIAARIVMCLTIAALISLIGDLDRPSRGLIFVSIQPLVDAQNGIPR